MELNRFVKIVLLTLICTFVFPCYAFAAQEDSSQKQLQMTLTTEITATSSTGIKIPAHYVKKENKYYLFMMACDTKSVPVSYVGTNGESLTTTLSFKDSDEAVLQGTQAGAVTVVFRQSEIPSLSISLNGTTLDEIHADKNVKWAGNSLIINDVEGSNSLTAGNVEIKGRGNSSWNLFDKKSYQIKFDKKTSVLGMDKAKKWILLPNMSDDSLLRNRIAYHLAEQLNMKNSLECRYVDLWIDGDYRGNYLLSEKVEIGNNRVNLSTDDGILCEWDDAFYSDEEYWFKNDALDATFSVKEAVNEDPSIISKNMDAFNSSLTEFMNLLTQTPTDDLTIDDMKNKIDIESFAQYYLINEFLLNKESVTTSWFWYRDGNSDVLHMGPVWDFDSSMYFYGEFDEVYIWQRNIFFELLRVPSFRDYITNYYASHMSAFENLSTFASSQANDIKESAEMNFIRWEVLGKESKTGRMNHDTYDEAVNETVKWLENRVSAFYFFETSITMHRLYNPNSGEHFYTADVSERDFLTSVGWTYEGVAWTSPYYSSEPVFRLYNPNGGDHHYTTSESERDYLVEVGWEYEGIGWYSDANKRVALLRQYNPNAKTGSHNFTTSQSENDWLVDLGWNAEGIGWYGL